MNEKEMITQIEALRHTLNENSCKKSFIDPEVLALSRRLDELLNQYQKMLQKKSIK